jgi:hypothetical protein
MYLYIYLTISFSIYLFSHLFIYLFVCLFVYSRNDIPLPFFKFVSEPKIWIAVFTYAQ